MWRRLFAFDGENLRFHFQDCLINLSTPEELLPPFLRTSYLESVWNVPGSERVRVRIEDDGVIEVGDDVGNTIENFAPTNFMNHPVAALLPCGMTSLSKKREGTHKSMRRIVSCAPLSGGTKR